VSTSLNGVVPQTTYIILCAQYTARTAYCMCSVLQMLYVYCTTAYRSYALRSHVFVSLLSNNVDPVCTELPLYSCILSTRNFI